MPANSPIPLPPQVSPRLQRMFDERRTLEQARADIASGAGSDGLAVRKPVVRHPALVNGMRPSPDYIRLFDDGPREEER